MFFIFRASSASRCGVATESCDAEVGRARLGERHPWPNFICDFDLFVAPAARVASVKLRTINWLSAFNRERESEIEKEEKGGRGFSPPFGDTRGE